MLTIFAEKASSQMFDSVENTQPENMCDIIFENTKGIYAEATVQSVLLKRCLRNFVEFTRKHALESLF